MNIVPFLFSAISPPSYSVDQEKNNLKQVAQGKAKAVWKKEGEANFVYYTPRSTPIIDFFRKLFGQFGLREQELRSEVMTAKKIKIELYKKKIGEFVDSLKIFSEEKRERTLEKQNFARFLKKKLEDLVSSDSVASVSFSGISGEYNASDETTKIWESETESSAPQDFERLKADLRSVAHHLTVDFEEGRFRKNNTYAVKTQSAQKDLEEGIKNPELDLTTRCKMGGQVLEGLALMQEAGYVHGDLKPENILVYKGNQLKIADYGKTKAISKDQTTGYTGNNYFAPPEWKLSQKGEVFSAGAILIRILEESVMEGNQPLMMPANKKREPNDKYRGFSRFLIMGNQTSHLDTSTIKGKITAIALSLGLIKPQKVSGESEVNQYIKVLITRLKEKSPENGEQLDRLGQLLSEMMNYDPDSRPTMDESLKQYKEIFPQI